MKRVVAAVPVRMVLTRSPNTSLVPVHDLAEQVLRDEPVKGTLHRRIAWA